MSRINEVDFVKAQSDNLPKVSVVMISDFFAENYIFNVAETRGVKTKRAESENYGNSAVGYVELKREGNTCHARGKICPEHRVNNKVYIVSVLVDEDHEKVRFVKCEDCAASEGDCKHAIAFLMLVQSPFSWSLRLAISSHFSLIIPFDIIRKKPIQKA